MCAFCRVLPTHTLFAASASSTPSALAAALLDRPSQSPQRPPLTRPTSYSVGERHNMRERVRSECSFSVPSLPSRPHSRPANPVFLSGALGTDSATHAAPPATGLADTSAGNSTSPSASPRPNAKLSLKPPRKMGMVRVPFTLHYPPFISLHNRT